MSSDRKRRVPLILFSLAGVYLLAFYGLPLFHDSSSASRRGGSGCIRPQKKLLASGQSPHGAHWTVRAGIRNNGDCRDWLLTVGFNPAGAPAGSWRHSWGIPAGGDLPDGITIVARDTTEGAERAVGGVVGARIRTVEFVMSKGPRLEIHPRLPARNLRERFTWLRNMRYFLRFYPTGRSVKTVRLLDRFGKVIFTSRAAEGAIEGPS